MSQNREIVILCLYAVISVYLVSQSSALLSLKLGRHKNGSNSSGHHGWKKGHDFKNGQGGNKDDRGSWNQKWDYSHWHNFFNSSQSNATNSTGSAANGTSGGPPPAILNATMGANGTIDLNMPNPLEAIKFLLRDRKGQSWVEININGTVPPQWQADQPVKLLIHGYSDKADTYFNTSENIKIFKTQNIHDIGMAYGKENASLNIILMDWTAYAGGQKQIYELVAGHVPMVGDILAGFLMDLEKEGHIKNFTSGVHLIGYCLGAHVAGIAGRIITEITGGTKVERITGLDPANAGFDEPDGKKMRDDELALTKEDAGYVDIIHCNKGLAKDRAEAISKSRFGSVVQSGHADFYPNGGETQKDCTPEDDGPDKFCSSRKCPSYFAKSIKETFLGCLCDDFEEYGKGNCECTEADGAIMGDKVSPSASGRYYLAIPKA